MRVLLTGHDGYIGAVMTPALQAAGHEVVGLDSGLFEECSFGAYRPELPALRRDIRDVAAGDLAGFDALVHLAAISNDPLGNLNPRCTYEINHRASVRLAELAKASRGRRSIRPACLGQKAHPSTDRRPGNAGSRPCTPRGRAKELPPRASGWPPSRACRSVTTMPGSTSPTPRTTRPACVPPSR